MSTQTKTTVRKIFMGIFLILFCLYPIFIFAQDTTSIELVGQFGGFVRNVALQEDYAYVLKNRVLTVLDISNNQLNQVSFRTLVCN